MLTIDPEFRDLMSLTAEERAGLEENIKTHGCRDPLVVWSSGDVLLDGHNRHDICTRNGIGYRVHKLDLPDREAAINWIINNQLGRRNLTPEQASYLRGKRYNREKGGRTGPPKGSCRKNYDNKTTVRTADRIADEYKVSGKTIHSDGVFAAAVDKLAEAHGSEIKTSILSRDSHVPKKQVIEAAREETPDKQLEVLNAKRVKAAPNGQVKQSVAKRVEQIRLLTDEGYRASQIADKLGVQTEYVRLIAGKNSIELVDRKIGQTKAIDANRIIRETVSTLEGLAMGLSLIDAGSVGKIDAAQRQQWSEALTTALKPVNKLRKQLMENAS